MPALGLRPITLTWDTDPPSILNKTCHHFIFCTFVSQGEKTSAWFPRILTSCIHRFEIIVCRFLRAICKLRGRWPLSVPHASRLSDPCRTARVQSAWSSLNLCVQKCQCCESSRWEWCLRYMCDGCSLTPAEVEKHVGALREHKAHCQLWLKSRLYTYTYAMACVKIMTTGILL